MIDATDAPDTRGRFADRGARQLARGVIATWWYTVVAVLMFELVNVLGWTTTALLARLPLPLVVTVGAGGLVWIGFTVVQMRIYREWTAAAVAVPGRRVLVPLLVSAAYGIVAGAVLGSWAVAVLPAAQSLMFLRWPRGVRMRVVAAVTVVLASLAFIDSRITFGDGGLLEDVPVPWVAVVFSVFLPLMTVLSLWWWDVLIALDRARVSESRLAAAQERLSVATDVHDLQGHHLQVIALQLELAERLLSRDAAAAAEQLRAARRSVDDARQGTRDLAMRFRSVPLRDELANARDLLRAADIVTDAAIAADVDLAPAAVFGPVIRETTTNVLRHGGGRLASLALGRVDDVWRYEISNDVGPGAAPVVDGSGLEGIRRRAREAGGMMEVSDSGDRFVVTVFVPAARAEDHQGEAS